MNFAQIIHPISIEEFFNDYYEKKPLHIQRNQANYYHSFLSLKEIDSYLQLKQTFAPNVKMAIDGKSISPHLYSDIEATVAPYKANPDKIFELLKSGHTIKYDLLHRTYPPLAAKVSALENELGIKLRTSLYFTPENAQGYGLHVDKHDVLALQLNGTKIWKVSFAEELLPSNYDSEIEFPWNDNVVETIELKSGDFFYCPRGLAHDVYTTDSSSIHFTIGFKPIYGYNVVENLATLAYQNVFFRKAIPNAYTSDSKSHDYKKLWKEELKKLMEHLDVDRLFNLSEREEQETKLNYKENRFLNTMYQPSLGDIFKVNKGISWGVKNSKVGCSIEVEGVSHHFPLLMKEYLENLINEEQTSFDDMKLDLSDAQKVKVFKRLLKLNLIALSDAS